MKLRRVTALTLGLFVSTTLSGSALADGYDWTGFYVGGHVGYGWIDLKGSHETEDAGPGETFETSEGRFDLDDEGFLGGFQGGFNYHIEQFVIGLEGDVSFTGLDDKLTNRQGEHVAFDTDLLATLRARAGVTFDNILLFGTVGAAWTDTNHEVDEGRQNRLDREGDIDLDDVGLAIGGGAEVALDERWSIKADALYLLFDDKEKTEDLTSDSEIGDFIKLEDLFVIRIGVNFHL